MLQLRDVVMLFALMVVHYVNAAHTTNTAVASASAIAAIASTSEATSTLQEKLKALLPDPRGFETPHVQSFAKVEKDRCYSNNVFFIKQDEYITLSQYSLFDPTPFLSRIRVIQSHDVSSSLANSKKQQQPLPNPLPYGPAATPKG